MALADRLKGLAKHEIELPPAPEPVISFDFRQADSIAQ